jgi:hypothetical protein
VFTAVLFTPPILNTTYIRRTVPEGFSRITTAHWPARLSPPSTLPQPCVSNCRGVFVDPNVLMRVSTVAFLTANSTEDGTAEMEVEGRPSPLHQILSENRALWEVCVHPAK